MPFQSEKQRRYLWANEPEIARDWADTYGSRIKKSNGGITDMVTVPKHWQSAPGHPKTELAYITKPEKDLLVKKDLHNSLKDGPNKGPGGVMSLNGGLPGQSYGDRQVSDKSAEVGDKANIHGGGGYTEKGDPGHKEYEKARKARAKDPYYGTEHEGKEQLIKKAKDKEKKFKKEARLKRKFNLKPFWAKPLYNIVPNNPKTELRFLAHLKNNFPEKYQTLPQNLKALLEATEDPANEFMSYKDFDKFSYQDFEDLKNIGDQDFAKYAAEFAGSPGLLYHGNVGGLQKYVKTRGPDGRPLTYGYLEEGDPGWVGGGDGQNRPLWMRLGYGSEQEYINAGGGGGGGAGNTAAVTTNTPSLFQQSLTSGGNNFFDYYVGQDPTATNIAWGKQADVDPRTMNIYKPSGQDWLWAAEGGRVPAAFGGIMDSSTGRKAYGIGSFFKSIGKAAKKVIKSPLGKIGIGALALGMPWGAGGTGGIGKGWFGSKSGWGKIAPWLLKGGKGSFESGALEGWNPWKMGIAGLTALPFLMGDWGGDEDEDEGYDYDLLKDQYAQEIARIKAGAMAGSLDPNKFNYLGVKDGGRIGYYKGGQSIPSDFTLEDAHISTTQDKLSGITNAMKQADLFRSGDVGQFYAAQGGRIGYDAGGQTGRPPLNLIKGDDQPVAPVPAPMSPNQNPMMNPMNRRTNPMMRGMHPMNRRKNPMMGGMNPMMARGMNPMMARGMNPMMARGMNPMMGGRKMAQEGGLMDMGGMEKDYRNDGGFVPIGGEEKADDVPARLSRNEFVFTADAVRNAGGGDVDKGAEVMENVMENLENGGNISEESQGLEGAKNMFATAQRLEGVI